ncbi:20356_t:CDS:2, partial [Funneliformis geosporum]
RDAQLLNETEFCDFEESDDFSDYDSDASWESFDKQAFNELPELEPFVFNQEEYIKAQSELEQEIIEFHIRQHQQKLHLQYLSKNKANQFVN